MMRRPIRPSPTRQQGVTLVELMVALVIGLIVTAGAMQIFLSSRQGYRNIEAVSQIQQDGRYAMRFLRTDIRMADYWGCSNDVPLNNGLDTSSAPNVDFGGPSVTGQENGTHSDTITIRGGTSGPARRVTKNANKSSPLFLNRTQGISEGQLGIVTDCNSGDLFLVTQMNSKSGFVNKTKANEKGTDIRNDSPSFSSRYNNGARFVSASERRYRVDTANDMLQRRINDQPWEDLVSGVEGMNILYGLDTDSDRSANAYLDATQVGTDWQDVVSVRIELLLRSAEDNVLDTQQDYTFPSGTATTTATDRRLRQVFSATVAIRNRLP